MDPAAAKSTSLLEDAERLLPRYLEATAGLTHESKGIRRSELFFFYALTASLNPTRIVESGRARAQSTLVLSRLFPETKIVSLESDHDSPDVAIAAERLRGCENVECRFGDSLRLLPRLVRPDDVVLIDGPKDFRALKLAFRLLSGAQRTAAVFVHDLWLGSPPRRFVDHHLSSALLSDEPRWVERYARLDSRKPIPNSLSQGRAYGATLGCFRAGAENYPLRHFQCRLAQGADRAREIVRKVRHHPPIARPKDYESPSTI